MDSPTWDLGLWIMYLGKRDNQCPTWEKFRENNLVWEMTRNPCRFCLGQFVPHSFFWVCFCFFELLFVFGCFFCFFGQLFPWFCTSLSNSFFTMLGPKRHPRCSLLQNAVAKDYSTKNTLALQGLNKYVIYIYICIHCITLHCIALHYIILYYITLHYTTYIHPYMHTCIHAYMHTCIHAYMHTLLTYLHTYMHTCIHACMHACIHTWPYMTIHDITWPYMTIHDHTWPYITIDNHR